jgi:hypothetical protein
MALLILATEQTGFHWPDLEDRITRWSPDIECISRAKKSRTYRLTLPDHGPPIAALMELQGLLGLDEVNFFIDLKS